MGQQWLGRAKLAEDRYVKAAKCYLEDDYETALKEINYVLKLRPTYLEALRLKERIVRETDPLAAAEIDRFILDEVGKEDTEKWMRR